jgi:hypothetical protein
MDFLTETTEVARWIPIVALVYILFLQGVLLYIVWLRHRERSQTVIKPDTNDTPNDDEN